jgi:hypothetical protein
MDLFAADSIRGWDGISFEFQSFELSPRTVRHCEKWMKINTIDYMLMNDKGQHLTSNGIAKASSSISLFLSQESLKRRFSYVIRF